MYNIYYLLGRLYCFQSLMKRIVFLEEVVTGKNDSDISFRKTNNLRKGSTSLQVTK